MQKMYDDGHNFFDQVTVSDQNKKMVRNFLVRLGPMIVAHPYLSCKIFGWNYLPPSLIVELPCVLQEVLHTISVPSGQVQRIVIFKKNGVQAMVEYPLTCSLLTAYSCYVGEMFHVKQENFAR